MFPKRSQHYILIVKYRKAHKTTYLRYLLYLCTTLCIAIQNLSKGVNVVSSESPSRILRVLLISLGITIRPKSSTLLTMPVAFIYLSPLQMLQAPKAPLCKGGWQKSLISDWGIVFVVYYNPSVTACAAPPPFAQGRLFVPTIILQITLLVSVNTRRLY